jgi:hypothetical protein
VVRRAGFEQRGEMTLHDGIPSYVCVYRCRSSSRSPSASS